MSYPSSRIIFAVSQRSCKPEGLIYSLESRSISAGFSRGVLETVLTRELHKPCA